MNRTFLPGNLYLANANPASDEKKTMSTINVIETIALFNSERPKLELTNKAM